MTLAALSAAREAACGRHRLSWTRSLQPVALRRPTLIRSRTGPKSCRRVSCIIANVTMARVHGEQGLVLARSLALCVRRTASKSRESSLFVSRCPCAAVDLWGKVDILINNAGILRDVSFHKMSDADW